MRHSGLSEPATKGDLDSLEREVDYKLRRLKSDLELERWERTYKWFLAVMILVAIVAWTVGITLKVQ